MWGLLSMTDKKLEEKRRKHAKYMREYTKRKLKEDPEYREKLRKWSREGQRRRRNNNPKLQEKERIYKLWHGHNIKGKKRRLRRIEALIKLGGCCVVCYEVDPFKLETHHPFKISEAPEFMVCVCTKCHNKVESPRFSGGSWIPCGYCGKLVWRKPYKLKKNKQQFCSVSCSSRFYHKNRKHDEKGRFK